MPNNIILFGQLIDITGTDNIILNDISDTDSLLAALTKKYPAFSNTKFVIAVDKKIIVDNTALNNNTDIALLPPFSGG